MTSSGFTMKRFYTCSCFFTDNIFLEEYKLHVRFVSENQFRKDYESILRSLGCVSRSQVNDVLRKINVEIKRRHNHTLESAKRAAIIQEIYKPLHQHVYHLQESFLAPELLQIVKYVGSSEANMEGLMNLIQTEAAPGVYRFPVFTKEFCKDLIEELEHFEQSEAPKGRPNTMNNYGILLNELGFDESFITPLRELYLHPLTALLYSDCGGSSLDSQKAFVVKYAMGEDLDLSYHYDNAEVTLNVSLGKEFMEGNLFFGAMRQVPLSETECVEVEHHVTEGLLHRGQHMHGALPISSGARWNLIIWMRASHERNKLCPMCGKRPTLVESEGYSDGFTMDPDDSTRNMSCSLP
ncbi:2-oxoglutarate and iron-dependent oxygenase domain-containing protein 2 isoform X1 [Xyrauchen texanus]|uniref:2-oxoglutarate and iron-dependent oxygenase domain-containing protein 2 isoform X1 n=1 Tax=Xyrauchen texanus TaxID=154827 RepID=UPI0022428FEA|nr:2-oxoglutarate and iron-dependent oxygenase domain-containing protein 2 isoform X1 [Xyrauchen texanus]XP_051954064.1 2-oxoglutarate and iron-dependent oxygenase domain-containing protein 2 isoform X1 [Xyrauchen texanus]